MILNHFCWFSQVVCCEGLKTKFYTIIKAENNEAVSLNVSYNGWLKFYFVQTDNLMTLYGFSSQIYNAQTLTQ